MVIREKEYRRNTNIKEAKFMWLLERGLWLGVTLGKSDLASGNQPGPSAKIITFFPGSHPHGGYLIIYASNKVSNYGSYGA